MCCPVCLRWQLLHICPNQWAITGLICFYKLIVDLASSSEPTRIPGKKLTVVCVGMPVITVYLSDFIDTPSAALGSRQGRDNYLLFADEVTEVHWVWGAGTPLCRLQPLHLGADVFSDFCQDWQQRPRPVEPSHQPFCLTPCGPAVLRFQQHVDSSLYPIVT